MAPSLVPVPQCSQMAPIPQIQPEQFLSQLQRNYHGDEGAEVFSTAWNTLMVMVSSRDAPGGAPTGPAKGDPECRRGVCGPQTDTECHAGLFPSILTAC